MFHFILVEPGGDPWEGRLGGPWQQGHCTHVWNDCCVQFVQLGAQTILWTVATHMIQGPTNKITSIWRPFNPCHLTLTPIVWWKVIHSTFAKAPKIPLSYQFLVHQIPPIAIKYFTLFNILNEWKNGRQHSPLTPYNSSCLPITYVRRSFFGPHIGWKVIFLLAIIVIVHIGIHQHSMDKFKAFNLIHQVPYAPKSTY